MENEIATLIRRADGADPMAADALFRMLYVELHRLAESSLRRGGGSSLTLGPTTLLHEAYLNIAGRSDVSFPDQARFLGYASRSMRGLIIDYVRQRRAKKRGWQFEISLSGDELPVAAATETAEELTQLSDALDELAVLDPLLAELVDMHFFCGFSFSEIASLRDVSARTVQRDWRKARLFLHQSLLEDAR